MQASPGYGHSAGVFGGYTVEVNNGLLGFPHFCYSCCSGRFQALFLLPESPPESAAELAGLLLGYRTCRSCCTHEELEWLSGWVGSEENFDRLWRLWREVCDPSGSVSGEYLLPDLR